MGNKKMETRNIKGMGGSHVMGYFTRKSEGNTKEFYKKCVNTYIQL